jgi:hypothetical protein
MAMALSGHKYQVAFRQEFREIHIEHFYQDLMTSLKFKGMIHEIAVRESDRALPGEEPMDAMNVAYLLGMFACVVQRALHPRTGKY